MDNYEEERNIEYTLVTDPNLLGIMNAKNIHQVKGMSFFDMINANLEEFIIGSSLDMFALKNYSKLANEFNEERTKYEAKLRTPNYNYSKEAIATGYDYLSAFLTGAIILYGSDTVCVDGNPDGLEVFCALYDELNPGEYRFLGDFVGKYNAKKQGAAVTMSMKKGNDVN